MVAIFTMRYLSF